MTTGKKFFMRAAAALFVSAAFVLPGMAVAEAEHAVIDTQSSVPVGTQLARQGYVELDGVMEPEDSVRVPSPYVEGEHFYFGLRERTSGAAILVRSWGGDDPDWDTLFQNLRAAESIAVLGTYKEDANLFSADKVMMRLPEKQK